MVMPSGGVYRIGWEYPRVRTRSPPWREARKPTPTRSRSRVKPPLTPCTMFATSVRVSPWRERWMRALEGRSTVIVPVSTLMSIDGAKVRCSVPRDPVTLRRLPVSRAPSTPSGTGIGSLPIRDIRSDLPHESDDFAAQSRALRRSTGHQTARGGDDRHTQSAEHARDFGFARIHAQPRTADTAQAGERASPRASGLERDREHLHRRFAGDLVAVDETLLGEHARDLDLHLRHRDLHGAVMGLVGVADAGQHVLDAVTGHGSPRALLDARNLPDAGELAETDPAHAELAHVGTRATAHTAAVVRLRGVPGRPVRLGDQRLLCHRSVLPEGHAEPGEKRTAFCIGTGGGHDADLQPAKLVDLVVVDLRKDELLAQPEGVVAVAVERLGVDPAEVSNARERDIQQLVEEVEHAAS